ncbi:extracellular solute-binding protein [Petroclostridium xylanilyticum]|uniref:extracellular solute-binding protein n=1 Tax=Petroclostridium xylanilyticum TaxID=1792311 RepID=UPI000B98AB3D|nr:extracellular solute-binding protein [Petroclostridium xylanilyticum]
MRVTVKKLLSAIVFLVISISLVLSGCGSKGKNQSSSNESTNTKSENQAKLEPITLSVYVNAPGQQPTKDNKIYKLIEEELGVKFQFEYLVGDSKQRFGVMIASGDYPDIVNGGTELINAGAFIPLEDLIKEHAPNLYQHYKPFWNKIKDPDSGKIYVMPDYGRFYGDFNRTAHYGPAFWIQKQVLEDAGYPSVDKINTLDEYFELIENYVKKNPTIDGKPTIGFEILSYDWRNFCLTNPPQHLIGKPNEGGVVVNYETNIAEIFADKDYAKAYYKKLNEINAKGLLDRETFTQNYDQYLAKIASGRVVGMFDQGWNFGSARDSLIEQGLINRTYVPLPVMLDESYAGHDWYADRPAINVNSGFGITVNAKDPIRIIKMFDTLITERWQKILQWGIEGEDYLVDKNGRFYRTPEQRTNANDQVWQLANKAMGIFDKGPKMEGVYSDGNACGPGDQPEEYFAGLSDYDKGFLNAYGFKTLTEFLRKPPENPIAYPAWQINIIDGSEAKIASTKLNDLSMKYLPRAILAPMDQFDAIWNEYVSEIRKLNIKAYEDRINEQIQWRIKNWSNN